MNIDKHIVESMCSYKVGYATKQSAKRASKKINKARVARGETPMRIYHCPICQFWHFTHKEKRHGETSVVKKQRTNKR